MVFGQCYANHLRRRRARPGDKWFLDEVFLKINGKTQYVWRVVDQEGNGTGYLGAEPTEQGSSEEILPQTA